jgi:hypothetical protein
LYGPEQTGPDGRQSSLSNEGANGRIRASQDPLAYITGASYVTADGQTSSDEWIYDVGRRRYINVTKPVFGLVAGGQYLTIDRVTPTGAAAGFVVFADATTPSGSRHGVLKMVNSS